MRRQQRVEAGRRVEGRQKQQRLVGDGARETHGASCRVGGLGLGGKRQKYLYKEVVTGGPPAQSVKASPANFTPLSCGHAITAGNPLQRLFYGNFSRLYTV